MDIERVNIVFNYDMPEDSDTYLHRVSKNYTDFKQATWSQFNVHNFTQGKKYIMLASF